VIGTTKVSFINTNPISIRGSVGAKPIKVYGSILTGLDPRGEISKECQDNYAFLCEDNTLLCVLFYSHGKDCVDNSINFFIKTSKHVKIPQLKP
jgi:hypothetical protein